MTGMVVTEAFFYMPSDPKDSALKVHTGAQCSGHARHEGSQAMGQRAGVVGGVCWDPLSGGPTHMM